jgi:hypothetical protein
MQLKVHGKIDPDGRLRLEVNTQLPEGEADVLLTITPSNGASAVRYDFSHLAGRLAWRGDAVAEQRGLRDEW